MASPRTIARLEAQILRRAAHCLQFEVNDPRASFITITRVKLASDISSGKIYYSVMGDAGELSKAAHMLKSAAGFIQRQVAGVLRLRNMPRLDWLYDDSVAESIRVDELIHEALERDKQIAARAREHEQAADETPEPEPPPE